MEDQRIEIDFATIERWENLLIEAGGPARYAHHSLVTFAGDPRRSHLVTLTNDMRRAAANCSALVVERMLSLVGEMEDRGGRLDPPPRRRQWD